MRRSVAGRLSLVLILVLLLSACGRTAQRVESIPAPTGRPDAPSAWKSEIRDMYPTVYDTAARVLPLLSSGVVEEVLSGVYPLEAGNVRPVLEQWERERCRLDSAPAWLTYLWGPSPVFPNRPHTFNAISWGECAGKRVRLDVHLGDYGNSGAYRVMVDRVVVQMTDRDTQKYVEGRFLSEGGMVRVTWR